MVLGGQLDDQRAMLYCDGVWRRDQAAVRLARERNNGALDIVGIITNERSHRRHRE
jgi:hypothetical protein